MKTYQHRSEEARQRKSDACKRRMDAMSPDERKVFSMTGVAARLAKNPKLALEVLQRNRKAERDALRLEVISHYGKQCKCCGEATLGFLTIDHVNNDGAAHKRERNGSPLYRWLRRNGFPPGFQVLCFNCNCSKGLYGQCAHLTARS